MKQIQFSTFGQPSVVAKCVEVDELTPPSAWEVTVDIEAFPINPADLAMLSGHYGTLPKPPSTIGMEAIGRISAVGSAVKEMALGDRVVVLANNNWAEKRKVPLAAVHRVPTDLDPLQLSMLKVNPVTAMMLLTRTAKLEKNDWVLQTAPLSSVGRCIIQIARSRGIRTINVVRRPEAKAAVVELGGDAVVVDGEDLPNQVRSIVGHAPVRVAFDAVGGNVVQRLSESLAEGGTIVNYGMLSGEACKLSCEQTIFRGITLTGFWLSKILNRLAMPERTELFDSVLDLFQSRSLNMEIDSTYPISKFSEAIAKAEQQGRIGKVVVTCERLGLHG